jgi:hypothetical protein
VNGAYIHFWHPPDHDVFESLTLASREESFTRPVTKSVSITFEPGEDVCEQASQFVGNGETLYGVPGQLVKIVIDLK